MESSTLQSHLDIIKKPRTNYSKNVLRMAVPNVDVAKKIESISMSKIKMNTMLRFKSTD